MIFIKFFSKSCRIFLVFIFVIFGSVIFYKNFNFIPKNKVLKIAVQKHNPPFNIKLGRENYIGFNVDVIKAICEDIGIRYEIAGLDSDMMIPSVESGLYDIGISTTGDGNIQKSVILSTPYLEGGDMILRKIGDDSSFKYKKIGIKSGSSVKKIVKKKFQTAQIFEFENLSSMYNAFNENNIDIIIENGFLLKYLLLQNKIKQGFVNNATLDKKQYVFIFPKDSKYQKIIEKKLEELVKSSKYKLLYNRWFGSF